MKKIIAVGIALFFISNSAAAKTLYCSGNGVNERTEPNTNSKIVTRHYKGDKIEVKSQSGDWYKLANGNWMSAAYLVEKDSSSVSYLYVKIDTVNERKEPSTDSRIIGHHKFGSCIKVIETRNGWSKIKNGGWIKSEFLVAPEKLSSDIIIINIGNQKATYYKDGKKVKSSSIVSGDSCSPTPTGCYTVTGKSKNTNLMGNTHVDYFVSFVRGIGIHDASWRKEFGGNIYKNNGSHGCVNVPLDFAKFVYENCSVGETIVLVI